MTAWLLTAPPDEEAEAAEPEEPEPELDEEPDDPEEPEPVAVEEPSKSVSKPFHAFRRVAELHTRSRA